MSPVSLSLTPGGAPISGTSFDLNVPTGNPPLRLFRSVFYLRLNGTPDKLTFDAAQTVFNVQFKSRTYNALNPPHNGLLASVDEDSDGDGAFYIVTLPAFRQFVGVKVSGSSPTWVKVYRMDGDAIAMKPTLDYSYSTLVSLSTISSPSQIGVGNTQSMALSANTGFGSMDASIGNIEAAFTDDTIALYAQTPFVDRRFGIRFFNSSSSETSVSVSALTEVNVQSFPTVPRVGIAPPDKLDEASFFWHDAEQMQSTVNANLGAQLAEVLKGHLRSLENLDPPLPNPFDVAIVIASDAECRFSLTQNNLTPLHVLDTFSSSEAKHTLRFETGGTTTQEVMVTLPRTAQVNMALVTSIENFRGESVIQDEEDGSAVPALMSGAYVGEEKWIAQPVILPNAASVSGVVLLFNLLTPKCELAVELHEDWQGQPSGKVLAAGSLIGNQIGTPTWITLRFSDAVILSTSPYWLVARATRGRAIWLAQPAETNIQVIGRQGDGSMGSPLGALDGLRAVHRFITRMQEGGSVQPATSFRVNGQTLSGATQEDESKLYNLAAALTSALASAASNVVEVEVRLGYSLQVPGLVTLRDLRIEYAL